MTVHDQGLGISEADREALFTEFFRSTNPRALAEPGTGLGLTICSRIVARHGGRIEVDSRIGQGSTFRVLLPTAAASGRSRWHSGHAWQTPDPMRMRAGGGSSLAPSRQSRSPADPPVRS